MRTWYNRQADQTIEITDDIGGYGVSVKSFLEDVRAVKSDSIKLLINSPGGDVFAGIAIYNALRTSGKTINVKVLGIAASAASLVAMAGDEIEMPENAMMMIHNPWSFAVGDADELRATAGILDKIGQSLVGVYAARTGKGEDEIKSLLSSETWMTAQEALEMGFATKVTPELRVQALFDLDRLPSAARSAFALAKEGQQDRHQQGGGTSGEQVDAQGGEEETPAETFAEQVEAVAQASGMAAYAALWAASPNLADVAAVKARAEEAREIKALCALTKQDGMADGLIRTGTTLAAARVAISTALESGEEHVDTAPKAGARQAKGAQPAAVKSSDIWAARRKHLQGA